MRRKNGDGSIIYVRYGLLEEATVANVPILTAESHRKIQIAKREMTAELNAVGRRLRRGNSPA